MIFVFYLFPFLISLAVSWYPSDGEMGIPGYHNVHNGRENAKYFINDWTVEVEGGEEVAQLVALELGYEYGGPVRLLGDILLSSGGKWTPRNFQIPFF